MKKTLLLNYFKAATSRNPRKNTTRFNGLLALFVMVMGMEVSWGQVVYSGNNGSTPYCTSGSAGTWLQIKNWCNGSIPTSTDIAQFGSTGSNGTIGFNMNGATTAQKTIGAIEITVANTIDRLINNSSTTASGSIIFNGLTINSISNVIMRNNSSSLLTIADGSSRTLGVTLANTENVINIDGSGGILISTIISGTSKNLTKSGLGSGLLTLSGANTYTGNTTVTSGTLQLNKTGGTTIPTTNTVTVSGGTLRISSNQTLASLNVTSGTVQIDSGVTLTIAGNVSIPSGVNLILNGVLTSTGTRTLTIASGANVTIGNTSGLETATGTFSGGKTFTTGANYLVSVATTTPLGVDVSANNFSTTESITLNSALSVSGSLSFGNVNSKTITTDGNLTLKSTSLGTACISDLTNGGANFGNTISGTVTVERYIPAKRAWRLLTAPLKEGSTSNTIGANWQGTANEGLLLFSPATYQTQTMTGYTTGGSRPNIWKYDSANTQWQSIPAILTENLFSSTVNNGFLVFATGPHGSNTIASSTTAEATTLKPKGQLITGSVDHTLAANKYHLLGNPYASPLDTNLLRTNNPNTSFWFIDPSSGLGSYITYSSSGDWSANLNTANDAYIQSGQGFFVKNAAITTFTIAESHKVSGNSNTWFERTTTDTSVDKIRVMLYKQINSAWQLADGVLAVNSASGNHEVDAADADKMTNFNENLLFKNGTSNLAIEYRGLPAAGTLQPMQLTGTSAQPYELRIKTENYSNSNLTPYLENTQTGVLTAIPTDGSEVIVPFTGIVATSAAPDSRFRIVYQAPLSADELNNLVVGVYPNPVHESLFTIELTNTNAPARYSLTNLLGQVVQEGSLLSLINAIPVHDLSEGMYLLQINQEGKRFTTKLMIK